MGFQIIWLATIVSVITTTLRAFNVGYNAQLYACSAVAYCIMIYHDWSDKRRVFLNGFYLVTAIVAVFRW